MAAARETVRQLFAPIFRPNFMQKCFKSTKFDPHECVIVRQAAAATTVPCLSPFPLKLETFLRLTSIPYKNRFGSAMSSKGKIPWIQHKNREIPDSNFCIKYLNSEFSVDLDGSLTIPERALARGLLTMIEENTYWTMVYYRWIENVSETVSVLFPTFSPLKQKVVQIAGKYRVKQYLHGHGMGRHLRHEIYEIAAQDIGCLSSVLADKPYLMGEKPTLVDTAAFGFLANIVWHDIKSPQHVLIMNMFKNLEQYCFRMKEHAWPDWDDQIETRKAIAHKKKK